MYWVNKRYRCCDGGLCSDSCLPTTKLHRTVSNRKKNPLSASAPFKMFGTEQCIISELFHNPHSTENVAKPAHRLFWNPEMYFIGTWRQFIISEYLHPNLHRHVKRTIIVSHILRNVRSDLQLREKLCAWMPRQWGNARSNEAVAQGSFASRNWGNVFIPFSPKDTSRVPMIPEWKVGLDTDRCYYRQLPGVTTCRSFPSLPFRI